MTRRLHPAAQAAFLMFLAAVAGAVSNRIRANPLAWRQEWSSHVEAETKDLGVTTVPLERAREISQKLTHVIIDARPPADFAAGHIPGAFNVPADQMETYLPQVMPLLTPAQPVMTYCSGHACDESVRLSKQLLQNGLTNVVLFAGGWTEWIAAKFPVEK
jgi:rhodanese-related sulfurtransferase